MPRAEELLAKAAGNSEPNSATATGNASTAMTRLYLWYGLITLCFCTVVALKCAAQPVRTPSFSRCMIRMLGDSRAAIADK